MIDSMRRKRSARVADIALEARVSTATVDRVLNGRGGVSEATEYRVREAVESIVARRPKRLRPAARYQFEVLLPKDAGPSTEYLGRALETLGRTDRSKLTCSFVEKMNPAALADRLDRARQRGVSGIAFQALDHPFVHDAVDRIVTDGIAIVALISALDGSSKVAFVGLDNRAAGRTAGFLMGRFAEKKGRVAVLWSGQLYRSAELREIGFRGVIRSEYPGLQVLDLVSGTDDSEDHQRLVYSALGDYPDLVGIYSVGGGNRGVVKALNERGRTGKLTLIGHNLTATTRRFLIDGAMDAVIHQDMELAARIAVSELLAQCDGGASHIQRLPIEIITRENMQGRVLSQ
jgi:LacI family transcriptional regulator